jgi:anti-sigma B factor antagonist
MSQPSSQPLSCPLIVLRIDEPQVTGDTLAETLRGEFMNRVGAARARHVVIDLSPVHYLSSAGFRPLLSLLKDVRSAGGRMVLCGLRPEVAEVFRYTRLISTSGSGPAPFEVQPDVRAAVTELFPAAITS